MRKTQKEDQILEWLEEELLAQEDGYDPEELEEKDPEDWEETTEAVYVTRNRRIGKLLLLALLEIAAIAVLIRWWITWW